MKRKHMVKNPVKDFNQLVEKVDNMKKKDKMDLSSDQDLSVAIMNLVSIEEHFFFTGVKTGKTRYYILLKQVREIRKSLLKRIIKNYEGEVWCISKHLLAASMRLMEVGTKQLGMGNKKTARDLFTKSFDLYSLFWGLNMNLVGVDGVKKIGGKQLSKRDKGKQGVMGKMRDLIKKAIDCCLE
ncbi:MAG: hypothetical protein ABIC19_02570 [Patescibacteria group bacterium]|nr:hypothetical protein [Patescibacteria group bacterium]